MQQCTKDFYQCCKDKKDVQACAAEYKVCVEALIPDYVVRDESDTYNLNFRK